MGVCYSLGVCDRVGEGGCEGGFAGVGDGREDGVLRSGFFRDLLGEVRVDAVYVEEAYGVPASVPGDVRNLGRF